MSYVYKIQKYVKKTNDLKLLLGGAVREITMHDEYFTDETFPFNHGVTYDIFTFFRILKRGILLPIHSGMNATVTPDKISLGRLVTYKITYRSSFLSYLPLQFFVKNNETIHPATHEGHVFDEHYSLRNIGIEEIVPVISSDVAHKKFSLLKFNYGFQKYNNKYDSCVILTHDEYRKRVEHDIAQINAFFKELRDVDGDLIEISDVYKFCNTPKEINAFVHIKVSLFFRNMPLESIITEVFGYSEVYICNGGEYVNFESYTYDDELKLNVES